MQVSVESADGLTRKLTVEIPAEQIDQEVDRRVADTAKKARIDGFRPGKVPRKLVKQRFGEALRAEVIGEVASQSFQQAVMQEDLKPVGRPEIAPTVNKEGENFEFVATFEVYPEFELADPAALSIEVPVAEVTDADIDTMVDKLRDQQADWVSADRAAKEGDQVNIDYVGTRDGEAFDGGSAEGTDLELGSGRMIDGFESGIVGMSAGEERVIDLVFPEDYHAEDLRSAAVQFKIKVNSVSEKQLPELDEAFFAKFEVAEGGLDAFRKSVRDNMEKQLKDAIDRQVKEQVMDGIYEQNTLDLPGAMIAEEITVLRNQSVMQLGVNPEQFDASLLPDEMFAEQAQKRVALGIILNSMVEHFEIRPDRDQVVEFIDEIAASYEDPEEVRNFYLGDETRLQQVQLTVVEKQVVERIREVATVTDSASSYEEVIQRNADAG